MQFQMKKSQPKTYLSSSQQQQQQPNESFKKSCLSSTSGGRHKDPTDLGTDRIPSGVMPSAGETQGPIFDHTKAIEEATRWLTQTNQFIVENSPSSGKHEKAISEADEWLNRTLKSLQPHAQTTNNSNQNRTCNPPNDQQISSCSISDELSHHHHQLTSTTNNPYANLDKLDSNVKTPCAATGNDASSNDSRANNPNQSYQLKINHSALNDKNRLVRNSQTPQSSFSSFNFTGAQSTLINPVGRPADGSSSFSSTPLTPSSYSTNTNAGPYQGRYIGVGGTRIANSGSLGQLIADEDFVPPDYENVAYVPVTSLPLQGKWFYFVARYIINFISRRVRATSLSSLAFKTNLQALAHRNMRLFSR